MDLLRTYLQYRQIFELNITFAPWINYFFVLNSVCGCRTVVKASLLWAGLSGAFGAASPCCITRKEAPLFSSNSAVKKARSWFPTPQNHPDVRQLLSLQRHQFPHIMAFRIWLVTKAGKRLGSRLVLIWTRSCSRLPHVSLPRKPAKEANTTLRILTSSLLFLIADLKSAIQDNTVERLKPAKRSVWSTAMIKKTQFTLSTERHVVIAC